MNLYFLQFQGNHGSGNRLDDDDFKKVEHFQIKAPDEVTAMTQIQFSVAKVQCGWKCTTNTGENVNMIYILQLFHTMEKLVVVLVLK